METLPFDELRDDPESVTIHYFIDEAGQPTLFRRRRESMVGQDGCSTYFILGKLDIDDPNALCTDLNDLRDELLSDPYFKGVPSMQPHEKKTALYFHAKDDLPEVRYQVFRLLRRHEMTFYAVVRDKHRVVEQVLKRNQREPAYRTFRTSRANFSTQVIVAIEISVPICASKHEKLVCRKPFVANKFRQMCGKGAARRGFVRLRRRRAVNRSTRP